MQPPELVLRFAGQGVQLDALGVGERLDAALNRVAIDTAALDRLPLRDDPRAGFGLRRVLVNEPVAVLGVEPARMRPARSSSVARACHSVF